jgi:adenylate kinase
MLNILMIGPQGSGKGTQSDLLAPKLGIPHLSLGTLLRAEVAAKSELGLAAAAYMERGDIVPPEVANKIMADRLARPDAEKGVIFDGYPRTAEQADAFDAIMRSIGRSVTHVIYLNVSDELAVERISGRRVCTNTACERIYHVEALPPKGDPGHCDVCGSPIAQRSDDVPDAIRRRLQIYHKDTFPLIELYRQRGLLREMDAGRPIDEVQAAITAAVTA